MRAVNRSRNTFFLALKLKPVLAAKAKETQGKRTDLSQKSAKGSPIDTREDLAKIAGVSP